VASGQWLVVPTSLPTNHRALRLEVRSDARGAEGDLEGCLDVDRGTVFHGGLELPLRYRLAGKLVEAVVDAAEDADIPHRAILVDNCVEDHRAGDILAHELQGIFGINFAGGHGLGEIFRRCGRLMTIRGMIEFGEADYPTTASGIQVRHVEGDGIKPAVAEDGAFGFGKLGRAVRLHGARWRAGRRFCRSASDVESRWHIAGSLPGRSTCVFFAAAGRGTGRARRAGMAFGGGGESTATVA
jgi:hypothetical protein